MCQWENYRRVISSCGFLPRTTQGRDAIKEADIRPVAKTLEWNKQRQMWRELKNSQAVNPVVS